MCNKSDTDKPNFLNLKSDTCPQCGSITSAIRVSHRPVPLHDGSTIRGVTNLKACFPCAADDDFLLTKVGRAAISTALKRAYGGHSIDIGLAFYSAALDLMDYDLK